MLFAAHCQSGAWRGGSIRSYVEYPYAALSSCATPGVCRVYVDNFTTTTDGYVLATGTHLAAAPYGSSYVQIIVDGATCAIDRMADTAGYHPYSSATCFRRLDAGSHQIVTYFVGDGASSVADAFGSRGLL